MDRYRILIIGNGGREHALAWKLDQSELVESILVVPGNGGTAGLPKVTNVDEVRADDYPALVDYAKKQRVDLVVPGPEAPLVDGIADIFWAAGIRCFGPSRSAARMEGSKAFSKEFMERHKIPTATYRTFTDYSAAQAYLQEAPHDVVIKASGLAAGKGVVIPQNKGQALDELEEMMVKRKFGSAGEEVVIEEFLEGEEVSILTFSDGKHIKSLPPAQDHKRIYDDDKGENTGGMGCYAPTKILSEEMLEQINHSIIQRTVDGMKTEGFPFVGVLFTGLMMTKNGPMVLEYNVRAGDPETQTLLPLLSSDTDLATIMIACTEGQLNHQEIKVEPKFCATVVVSAGGYPGSYEKGTDIRLDKINDGTMIFHAGTSISNGKLRTSGGRVIAVSAIAQSIEDAVSGAYEGVGSIHFNKMHYRKDIARRAIPKVAVLMGSDSDLKTLEPGLKLLEDYFGVKPAVKIASAHRTPTFMASYASSAESRGIQVIIAAAGGAAHLPGMVAAHTDLPVIGVPVKASSLDGLDSLLSIVQMPRGVPVATMAINNSINAAIYAAKILALNDKRVRKKLVEYRKAAEVENLEVKGPQMDEVGWRKYLELMKLR